MNELKILIGNYMIAFLLGLALIYVIGTRIENKAKKVKSKKVNRNLFSIDCDAFMEENYSTQEYIGQSKNKRIELIRLVG